jgi:hypothetical protein
MLPGITMSRAWKRRGKQGLEPPLLQCLVVSFSHYRASARILQALDDPVHNPLPIADGHWKELLHHFFLSDLGGSQSGVPIS